MYNDCLSHSRFINRFSQVSSSEMSAIKWVLRCVFCGLWASKIRWMILQHMKRTHSSSSWWWWCDDEDSFRSILKTIQIAMTSKGTKRANLMQDTNVHYYQIRGFHRKKGCRTLGLLHEFNLVSLTVETLVPK